MQVSRQDKSPTNVILSIEGRTADLEPIRRHVISHFRRSVRVPGFRAGKAPDNLIEQHIDQQAFLDEFMEHALNELYRQAVETENIRPVSSPDVRLKKFVPYSQLEFEADTEILGQIKLPDYKNLKLAKKKAQITDKDINSVIKSLRTKLAQRLDTGRPAKEGDELTINFEGTDKDGKKINGAGGQDYALILGSGTFIPGFEDNLIGAKAGDTKSFEVTFPKDYGVGILQNKRVTFKVDVTKVQELKEPKIDNEMAKKAGAFKNLAELRDDIKKQLMLERQQQLDTDYNNQLVREIAEKTELEVPSSLVKAEIRHLEDQEKQNIIYRGQTWQEHLAEEGLTEEEHSEKKIPEARERVKIGLILTEIAEREGITVTSEEAEIRLQILKAQYQDPQMQAELDKPANQREIKARLLTEKTIAKLRSYTAK